MPAEREGLHRISSPNPICNAMPGEKSVVADILRSSLMNVQRALQSVIAVHQALLTNWRLAQYILSGSLHSDTCAQRPFPQKRLMALNSLYGGVTFEPEKWT